LREGKHDFFLLQKGRVSDKISGNDFYTCLQVFSGDVQMDKNRKQGKALRAKAEEAALNRILSWFVGGTVLEFLLLLLNRFWNNYTVSQIELRVALGTAVKILAVAALLCAGGAAAWWNGARKTGKKTNLPGLLSIFMLGLSLSCFATWFLSSAGLRFAYIMVPVVVVLAMVYYLYQREFFLMLCQSVLGIVGVWICGKSNGGMYSLVGYAYVALAVVAIVLAALLCRKLQGTGGSLEDKSGRRIKIFSTTANYALLYAGAILATAALLCAALGVSPSILYAVQVAWLLIMAVYYTVKLM